MEPLPTHNDRPITHDQHDMIVITGSGRSGTTWLGEMISATGKFGYKYEPFSPSREAPYNQWALRLDNAQILEANKAEPNQPTDEQLRREFHDLTRKAYWGIDRPPLTHVGPDIARPLLNLIYKAGFKAVPLRTLFERAARPAASEPILIKDVWFPNTLLGRLDEVMAPKLISIVRFPHAAIHSVLNGRKIGAMDDFYRKEVLDRIQMLSYRASPSDGLGLGSYFDDLVGQLDELNETQLEAVRWRLEAEPTAKFAAESDRGYNIIYEDLVAQPEAELRKLFDFLDVTLTDEVLNFVSASHQGSESTNKQNYFGTTRDPSKVAKAWEQGLSAEQRRDIDDVVADSWLMSFWDEAE